MEAFSGQRELKVNEVVEQAVKQLSLDFTNGLY